MYLPWGEKWHPLMHQTAIINRQGYLPHLDAILRTRWEKTLPHQSQSKNILNGPASKVKNNIDESSRLTDTLIIFMP